MLETLDTHTLRVMLAVCESRGWRYAQTDHGSIEVTVICEELKQRQKRSES